LGERISAPRAVAGTIVVPIASQINVTSQWQPGPLTMQAAMLSPPSERGWVTIFDHHPGAWQQDAAPINTDKVLANWAVWACMTLIARDVGKLNLRLVERDENGIWNEAKSAAFGPVLRKPNTYQTRQQFLESWLLSKLGPCGNTYVMKVRDNRGIVVQLHVLDPYRVTPLIAPNGSVFYRLGEDPLTQVRYDQDILPASEIIHDRQDCLFHHLVGVSPIYSCGLSAMQGLQIQESAEKFFRNRSMPGGIITAPKEISDATADRIRRQWNERYTAENAGKVAVLGDQMTYTAHTVNARDSQLAEQLGLTAKAICSAYHVPPFKIGIETLPSGQKPDDMNRIYHSDCLDSLLKSIEDLLDEGLGLDLTGRDLGTEFDLDGLLRMDQATFMSTLKQGDGIMTPNEQRKKLNLPPVDGGASVYKQEQDHSLEALRKRDAKPDPWASSAAAPPSPPSDDDAETAEAEEEIEAQTKFLPSLRRKAA